MDRKKLLSDALHKLVDEISIQFVDIKPSEWAEQNRTMGSDETSRPGKFSYAYTPYLKEVADCLSENHPARVIAVMKGAQIGFSTGVIENGLGWIIGQSPGNTLFLSGHQDLSEEAMNGKIDKMIDSCGLRPLIRPNVLRKRNQRTGDTSKSKEFPGGSLTAGSANNHKLLRQRSVRYGFIDDFDSAKKSSTDSGNTRTLIQQRFAAYYDKMKLFYISTPELKETSNIEPVFLLGDQRRYFVPCPCCGEYIPFYWETDLENGQKGKAGVTWRVENGKLLPETVGYICQKCGDFFDDSRKLDIIKAGEWRPTAEPSEVGYYSYHISCLYAPPGMYDWTYYVRQYLEANPPGGNRKEDLHKTFINLCLGETYEPQSRTLSANALQKQTRGYEIGVIPEAISIEDGNGKIVLVTCACDLNGTEYDARLDYQVVAWSETGSSYNIKHGSIGTFVPRETQLAVKKDRERWSYDLGRQLNVWKEFDIVLNTVFNTDTGRRMKIFVTGVDTGFHRNYAYAWLDKTNFNAFGLKGKDKDKYFRPNKDITKWSFAKERSNLYLVEVSRYKDDLADIMNLKWVRGEGFQPPGFMNFPQPGGGLYGFENFFEHFEAEHRTANDKGEVIWKKKNSSVQNHQYDCHIYNMALVDILIGLTKRDLPKDQKDLHFGWAELVKIILGK